MRILETLADRRDLILLAEIGALIHDLGKLSKEFIESHAKGYAGEKWEHELVLRRLTRDLLGRSPQPFDEKELWWNFLQGELGDLSNLRNEYEKLYAHAKRPLQERIANFLGKVKAASVAERSRLVETVRQYAAEKQIASDFIPDGFVARIVQSWDMFGQEVSIADFIEEHGSPVETELLAVRLLKPPGCDGVDSAADKGAASDHQVPGQTRIATAFGHEPDSLRIKTDELKQVRHDYANNLALILQRIGPVTTDRARPPEFWQEVLYDGWQTADGHEVKGLRALAETAFRQALGETRRAANDVTLWDHSFSVASLYKAALVKVLVEEKWTEPKEIGWRFLRVGVDGLRFFAQAHHVTDILGRQQALTEALDRVRDILEVDYPLGNEVYRDENGSIFVVPGLADETHKKLAEEIEKLVLETFHQGSIGSELVPRLTWNEQGPVRREMVSVVGELATRDLLPSGPEPKALDGWWQQARSQGKEICTVCGQRPMGYVEPGLADWVTPPKAKDRHVCGVCLHRRGRRAHSWTRNECEKSETIGPFERTIWTDEVADDNGRFALVVGRFGLEGWLDGKLIRTMLVNPNDSKNPSPARIRRCWDTTRQFWLDVQQIILPEKVGKRFRLGIRPSNASALNHPDPNKGLGRWHTYEADIKGRRLGLCWDPNDETTGDRDLFWTTDNLRYLGRQLGIKEEAFKSDDSLQAAFLPHINGQTLTLYEPGGYLGQDRQANADAESCLVVEKKHFRPFIPLLAEPATFMALAPASAALEVVKRIRGKYEEEMARVRDRLPLHLGLVFAPRRTPLAAVLDVGRAMLKMPDRWEVWQVQAAGRKATFSRNGQTFEWEYPSKMGDDKTSDIWYPHLLAVDPTTKETLDKEQGDFRPVDDLADPAFIRPSRFDFAFLDTTARRFEIHYAAAGRRPARPTRPFYLDDLDRLEKLWEEMKRLEKSQRRQVIAAIEAAREAWFGDDREGRSLTDETFRRFVRDTLAGAAWPKGHKWRDIADDMRNKLETAGVSGELADLAELSMHILKE